MSDGDEKTSWTIAAGRRRANEISEVQSVSEIRDRRQTHTLPTYSESDTHIKHQEYMQNIKYLENCQQDHQTVFLGDVEKMM